MEHKVREIITSKSIVNRKYEVYRLHNTYKSMNKLGALDGKEEPDIEMLCIINAISLLGAIGHIKNILLGLLTHEDYFGRYFYEKKKTSMK